MQIIISALSANFAEFTDAQNAALDGLSLEMTDAHWHAFTHDPYFPNDKEDEVCIKTFSENLDHMADRMQGVPVQDLKIPDFNAITAKLRALTDAGIASGCDRIGVAG